MSKIIAIDPGNVQSGWVVYEHGRILDFGKQHNKIVLGKLRRETQAPALYDILAIEMIASYGMPVGKTVFETVLWIGQFIEAWTNLGVINSPRKHILIYRKDIKKYICGSAKTKDTDVRQALIKRFGKIGTTGISADIWSALAVAVTCEHKLTPDKTAGVLYNPKLFY